MTSAHRLTRTSYPDYRESFNVHNYVDFHTIRVSLHYSQPIPRTHHPSNDTAMSYRDPDDTLRHIALKVRALDDNDGRRHRRRCVLRLSWAIEYGYAYKYRH